jgi:hypothetical protein
MHPDDPPPAAPEDEAARLMQEELAPIALSPCRREALLRRILERTGGAPPLAPAPPLRRN